jgi:hypothetical protein
METSAVAVASWGSNRLDIFGVGSGNGVFHKSWASGAWDPSQTDWESIGGTLTSPPAVVSWGPNRLDVFGVGPGGAMFHKSWANGAWSPSQTDWESIGGLSLSPPTVCSWGPNRLDVFALGTDYGLYHKTWDGSGAWQPSQTQWFQLGGTFVSPPVALSWGPNRFDLFGIGQDGAMYHKAWTGAAWDPSQTGWDSLGGAFSSPPAVASWGPNRLDIFGLGTDGNMYHKAWSAGAWDPAGTDWELLYAPPGEPFTSPPAVASSGPNQLDIVGMGDGGALYHKAWANGAWIPSQAGWEPIGGTFSSAPAVASWGANRLDVLGLGTDKAVYHKSCAGGIWDPPDLGWESLGGTFLVPLVQVPPPKAGLVGRSNYFLDAGGAPLTGVVVTVKFTEDFVSTNNGFSFQLNCYSAEGPGITTEWQQFVIYTLGGLDGLTARIDTWSGRASSKELNRIDASLFADTMDGTIKAGCSLVYILTYVPGSSIVSGANYMVLDQTGAIAGTASISIVGQSLRTTGQPATAANLAPIVALQFNIGGDWNSNTATLSGGVGTISYSAWTPLIVAGGEPSYTDFDDGTGETANVTYGTLPGATPSSMVVQSFQASAGASAAPLSEGRGRGLPPADDLSRGKRGPAT